ncbi:hypothetical protein GCM10010207_18580 [Streptomyces atratus]|uniref:COG4315 family predicted lipoprotein n=1 Tax=Streptomyces atratus TaxID=1893 RepID=UPI00166F9ADB|nr:hypothetical protein [Streptomyces atratus]GGT19693.1 hypothetical protein GCM10010207_18580 [Streptomyces atratus]
MKIHTRVASAAAIMLAVAALATACSSGGGSTTTAASAPASSDATAAAAAGAVSTSSSPTLGTIIVNEAGRTLYAFDKDTTSPAMSNCYTDCAAKWPAVPATTTVKGIDPSLLGSVTRKDGTKQLTIKNHPVYLFAGDQAAGDTQGQALKGVWHALTPQGTEIKTPKA